MKIPDQISGYITLPIKVGSKNKEPVYHVIYLKKHQSKDKANDRTVFAVNLPIDTTYDHIKQLCQSLGNTLPEEFTPIPGTTRAQIVMVDKSSCNRLLSKAKNHTTGNDAIVWPKPEANGSAYYLALNRNKYLDQEGLQEQVDAYMEEFERQEEEKQREVLMMSEQVDEEGFTTVVYSKRKSKEGMAAPVKASDVQPEKKKKKKEKEDFYRFQLREKKKSEMNNLLKRFQSDKEKVKELREKRRFKPY
ncbi:ribosomal RNA-processing protein 7 [Trichomonascus vanleenenianus]|uniref:Rrp7p n=1 Tax=Trichomonascus vanleenenianus TaxID=2268995 RepID=UPI003ECAB9A2